MNDAAAVIAGGAVGTLARAGLAEALPVHPGTWPWATFAANIAGEFEGAEPLPAIVHAFTHYRLHLHPLRWDEVAARTSVADNGDLRWVRADELGSLGVPAPVRRLLTGSMKELVQ